MCEIKVRQPRFSTFARKTQAESDMEMKNNSIAALKQNVVAFSKFTLYGLLSKAARLPERNFPAIIADMKEPPLEKISEEKLAALRRMAAEHLSELMNSWAGFEPAADTPGSKGNSKEPDQFLGDFQKWLNPFKDGSAEKFIPPEILRNFKAGLEAYRNNSSIYGKSGRSLPVWRKGTTVLRDYAPGMAGNPAIVIVPSLINRYSIFDLTPEHSFLGYAAAQGLHPFIIDWDEPGEEEKRFSISDYITQRLLPAVDFIISGEKGSKVHLLGYCMGGLFAVALALLKPETVRSLVLMATPWNFTAAGAPSAVTAAAEENRGFEELASRAEPFIANCGWLPAEALRAFFASLQPLQVMEKFARFSETDQASAEAERFVLSEDWLNDGVPLAAPVARECLKEWYGENKPGRILWRVAGVLMDPRLIACPAYVIAPAKDRLVPPESSRPLARFIRGAVLQEPNTGHIGLLAGGSAPEEIWKPLLRWLSQH